MSLARRGVSRDIAARLATGRAHVLRAVTSTVLKGEEHACHDTVLDSLVTPPPAAGHRRSGRPRCRRTSRTRGESRQGSRGRLHLCRAERRLWIQPGARRSRGDAEEDAGRQDRRGREGSRNRRRVENHGEHDQAGRRDAAVPHQLRLFRPVHAEDGGQVQGHPVPPLRRPVAERQAPDEHRVVFRLHRHVPVSERHRRRPCHEDRRRSASSPPSRSRRC